jgi:DNA helicase-2/ATP-dependent DNA helicase PcrA
MIRGKDIGASLVNLIKRFETDDISAFNVSLLEYFDHEYNKLLDKGKEMQAVLLQDKVQTLQFIVNECNSVHELMAKIEMLFSDNNNGVIFSSIHRAKGLEADNVYILRPDLMPHPKAGKNGKEWELQQEQNGIYVAQTRSKDNLIFVQGGQNI